MGSFYDPSSGLFALLFVLFLFSSGSDVRSIAKVKGDFFDKAIIIPLIQTQVLQSVFGGRFNDYSPKRINQNSTVRRIGSGNTDG
jgi:hypothetical protein